MKNRNAKGLDQLRRPSTSDQKTATPVGTRKYLSVVGVFGFAQAAIAISAVIRIPFILGAIGPSAFGAVAIVGALCPLCLVAAASMTIATRAVLGESLGRADLQEAHRSLGAALRLSIWVSALQASTGISLCLLFPVASWLGLDSAVSNGDATWALILTIAVCSLACPGGVWVGVADAERRPEVLQWLTIGVTAGGLIATISAALLGTGFLTFSSINAATSAGPLILAMIPIYPIHSRRRRPRYERNAVLARAALYSAARASSELAVRGFDPFIVGGVLGPSSAAGYSITQRLSTATTLIPQATAPLLAGVYSHDRGSGNATTRRALGRTVAIQMAIAAIMGTLLVAIGPFIVRLLATGRNIVWSDSRSLFAAFALLGLIWAVHVPLTAAMTGSAALRLGFPVNLATGAVNIALSVWLAVELGVTGPVLGSVIAVGASCLFWIGAIWLRPTLLSVSHVGSPPGGEVEDQPELWSP